MKQVQFFYGKQLSELQEQVNNFLTTKKYDEVIDIQMTSNQFLQNAADVVVVMVTYRDTELGNHRRRDKE